jgi:sugar phosphate isomerase/epimerase
MLNKLTIMAASLPDTPPLEFIEAADDAGYDGIGLRLHQSPSFPRWQDWLSDEPLKRAVKRALTYSGLEMNEILSYYMTPDVDLGSMAPSLEYGAQLGATYVWITSRDDDWNRQCDSIGKFCDMAAGFDLTVMLGTPVNNLSPIQTAFRVVDEVRRPNCVVCVGVGLYLRSGNLADLKGRNRRLLPLIHFNNGTPAAEVAALMDELPMDVVVSVESPNRTGRHYTAKEWCEHTIGVTERFLEAYRDRTLEEELPTAGG